MGNIYILMNGGTASAGGEFTALMHSNNVDEVFAEDHELRRHMRRFLREEEAKDERLEAEIRSKLKHVQEGTRVWEIEYERMKAEIKRRRGM